MAWKMLAETAPLDRVWMAFPLECFSMGDRPEETYAAWTGVAHAASAFVSVTMVVDPSESARAERMLGSHIERVTAPLDDFWMRDMGPTFVVDDERPGVLGAVDWTYNGWGAQHWARWSNDREIGRFVGRQTDAEIVSSLLVNEGGAIHSDGEGTLLVTETVQLDPQRNPYADKESIEAEFARTLGAEKVIWLPRGLTRDYEDLGTRGHVDMVAAFPSPGHILLHDQRNSDHPDHAVTRALKGFLSEQTDARGRTFDIIDLPAPEVQRDDDGYVDFNYVNHLVANDGIIACGFGEPAADAYAAGILGEQYGGKTVVTLDARPIMSRGGGIHCITQQQPTIVA
ncbi:agmatine deiminase family protein [Lacisediminihabitans changchengi]|uniref:Agmatine deiminase family protein n=1 Tax=Lacisediminihabitans changchengi TaxID=2787634 RepID=A0A934SLC7_9MICO|nr:agmatine deiminase family protein [Lacisediminihabitans changchengi]MBK4348832.1 agmatine deiminase family protein [Lacisediminihabitans changchengi]